MIKSICSANAYCHEIIVFSLSPRCKYRSFCTYGVC